MFHFKKFSIDDSKAAMKIGTDAVLLGAWVPCGNESRILDIGTGSGILALMMAQRNTNTSIDAVEVDEEASILAQLNVQLSPWSGQIHTFNTSIQEFSIANHNNYSLIICNPPFFTDALKAPDKARSTARHNDTLPVKDLLTCSSSLLTENGIAAFIIPADAYEKWKVEAAKQNLYPTHTAWVKSSESHAPHRVMIAFSRCKSAEMIYNEISIYSSKNMYSQAYKQITRDFYLNF